MHGFLSLSHTETYTVPDVSELLHRSNPSRTFRWSTRIHPTIYHKLFRQEKREMHNQDAVLTQGATKTYKSKRSGMRDGRNKNY